MKSRLTLLTAIVVFAAVTMARAAAPITINPYENIGPALKDVPVTFSQVGAAGDFKAGMTPLLDGYEVPAQVDVLRRAPDGSIRHALVSFVVPSLPAGGKLAVGYVDKAPAAPAPFVWTLDRNAFALKAVITPEAGEPFTSDAGAILKAGWSASKQVKVLYDGPVMKEFEIHDVPKDPNGKASPSLDLYWRIRVFTGQRSARVALAVERTRVPDGNVPAIEAYNGMKVLAGDKVLHEEAKYRHCDRMRYQVICWTDGELENIHRRPEYNYWVKGRFVPLYRPTQGGTAAQAETQFGKPLKGATFGILNTGVVARPMHMTGGRPDIGLYPGWAAAYLVFGAPGVYASVLHADGNAGGSYFIHIRQDADTPGYDLAKLAKPDQGRPKLPDIKEALTKPDHAHSPSLGYISYLLTGDKYYAEEMSFWASYQLDGGLVMGAPERAQAWSMRHVVDAAFILPESQPLRAYFEAGVNHYLDAFTKDCVSSSRKIHWAREKFEMSGRCEWVNANRCSSWMAAWLACSLGNAADKGFDKAPACRDWMADYIVGLYTSKDKFTAPDGKVYQFDPADAMAYNIATSVIKTKVVTGKDGLKSIEVIPGSHRPIENYGEVWYYTKMNEDNGFYLKPSAGGGKAADKGGAEDEGDKDAWKGDRSGGLKAMPDENGNWPVNDKGGWGHGNGGSSHRYGAWVGVVMAVEAGLPNAEEAWTLVQKFGGPQKSYGFEMIPRPTGATKTKATSGQPTPTTKPDAPAKQN